MTTSKIQETTMEIRRIFPSDNYLKIKEWNELYKINEQEADKLLQTWRSIEIKQRAEEAQRQARVVADYTELGDKLTPLGISVFGSAEIGEISFGNAGILKLHANEFVHIDSKIATHTLTVVVTKGSDVGVVSVKYEEINNIFSVIDKIKRVGANVSKFKTFEVKWTSSDGFSLAAFNNKSNEIKSFINADSVTIFLDCFQQFNDIAILFQKAINYIDEHCQQVGHIGFKLMEENLRAKKEFEDKLPGLIVESTNRYMQVLAKKFVQLTYVDDYDTREYGSFHSEVDRFIGKVIPGLNDEQRVITRTLISNMVEDYALDPANNIIRIDPNMDPLDYERYCAKSFSQSGWGINLTPKTGDQGADIIINNNNITAVVQCKLYSQPVGNGAVQEVIAAREYYQAPIALVVSNASFTTSARQLAATANVYLMHHSEIATYSTKLGVEPVVAQMAVQA